MSYYVHVECVAKCPIPLRVAYALGVSVREALQSLALYAGEFANYEVLLGWFHYQAFLGLSGGHGIRLVILAGYEFFCSAWRPVIALLLVLASDCLSLFGALLGECGWFGYPVQSSLRPPAPAVCTQCYALAVWRINPAPHPPTVRLSLYPHCTQC